MLPFNEKLSDMINKIPPIESSKGQQQGTSMIAQNILRLLDPERSFIGKYY